MLRSAACSSGTRRLSPKVKRLHFVGNCPMVPGLNYFDFEVFGDNCPEHKLFEKHCLNCFPEQKGMKHFDEELIESSDSGTSSTSSSTSE